jgi:uncharacterized protein YndB with AHSA1/START domain
MTEHGTLIEIDGRPTLRFERRLAAPVERVWRAVTEEDEMRSWFPSAVQGERKVGAPLRFPFDEHVADSFDGAVLTWEPMRVFEFTWNGDVLRIELRPDGDGTTLVFTQQLYDASIAARTGSGWHLCLARLDEHLGGDAPAPEMWKDLYPAYLERMGPAIAEPAREWALRWRRAHHVSPARMWECLTDPAELEAWMASGPVEIDLRLGGTVRFFGEPHPEVGVIVALEDQRRIAYTWGESLAVVDWRIEPTDFGCRYELHKHGMPEGRAAGWGAGWHSFLLQLDMYAAAGQLVVDEHEPRIPAYEQLLA